MTTSSAMTTSRRLWFGFRPTCLFVGGVYVLLGGMVLARGVDAMADYGVPELTLTSPHYADAIQWVYLHMVVLGLVIGVVGFYAEGERLQLAFARLMLGAHVVYSFLDVRASDSMLGTGLYRGPGSIAPAIVCLVVLVAFARLSFRANDRPASAPGA